jgi:hypothetical protein
MSGSGTVPSSGGAGFCGMIDVTVVLARPGRVCTGFTSKCFSTPSGNKSSWRSRIAFAHIDERERFNHLEICVADAVGQRLTSKKVSSVVQGIIRASLTRPVNWASTRHRIERPDEIPALALGRGGDLNQRKFLAGDAHTMKIETTFGKLAIWMCPFWQ